MNETGAIPPPSLPTDFIRQSDLESMGLAPKGLISSVISGASAEILVQQPRGQSHQGYDHVVVAKVRINGSDLERVAARFLGSDTQAPLEPSEQIQIILAVRSEHAVPDSFTSLVPSTPWEARGYGFKSNYVTVDVRTMIGRRAWFTPMVVRKSDLANFLWKSRAEVDALVAAGVIQDAISNHLNTFKKAISSLHLHQGPFTDIRPDTAQNDTVTVWVLDEAHGAKPMYTTYSQLATYLGLPEQAVRAVVLHRSAEELILRTRTLSPDHLRDYIDTTKLQEQSARMMMIFTDIILDNPEITSSEIDHYQAVPGSHLSYDPVSRIVTVGERTFRGKGSFGEVYSAHIEALGPIGEDVTTRRGRVGGVVAEKTLLPQPDACLEEQNAAVEYEVEMAMAAAGPYINQIHSIRSNATGQRVIMLESCEGGELAKAVDMVKAWPLVEHWEFACQILEGIQGMHEKGIVHLDLRPENILLKWVNGRWEPRIIDFGLAQRLSDKMMTDLMKGSKRYIPPEDWEGNLFLSPGRDAFAAGAIIALVFMGVPWYEPTFQSRREPLLMNSHVNRFRTAIDEQEHLPKTIRNGIMMLCDRRSSERNLQEAIRLIREGIATLRQTQASSSGASSSS